MKEPSTKKWKTRTNLEKKSSEPRPWLVPSNVLRPQSLVMSLPSAGRTRNSSSQTPVLPNSIHHLHTFTSGHLPLLQLPLGHGQLVTSDAPDDVFFAKQTSWFLPKKRATASGLLAKKHVRKHVIDIQLHRNAKPQKNHRPSKHPTTHRWSKNLKKPLHGTVKIYLSLHAWRLNLLLGNVTTITHLLHVWHICSIMKFMVNVNVGT